MSLEVPVEKLTLTDPMSGPSFESYLREARGRKTKRSLLCMLRDARHKLAHHGRRSWMGRQATKEIDAARAECLRRGIKIPQEDRP